MSFLGDLHTFDLFDLLGWLMGRKKAGVLLMTQRSTKKRLAFRDGAVQWTSSNDPRETIGQALVRDGLITEEALFRALLKQETDKRRLGELLIADGHLTEPQLMKTLRTNAEAHLHDLFLWGDGRFEFDDERPPAPEAADLKIDLKPVLEEGRHRRERWSQLLRSGAARFCRSRYRACTSNAKLSTTSGSTGSPFRERVSAASPSRSPTWKNWASEILLGMHSRGPTETTASISP